LSIFSRIHTKPHSYCLKNGFVAILLGTVESKPLSTTSGYKNSMNKAALVERIADRHNITKADAERIMETIIDSIASTLKGGGEVAIAGLGAFKVRARAARTARNPRTGAMVQVPATKVPKFTAAKALKEAVK